MKSEGQKKIQEHWFKVFFSSELKMAETFSSCRDGDTLAYILIPVFLLFSLILLFYSFCSYMYWILLNRRILVALYTKTLGHGSTLPPLALKKIEKKHFVEWTQANCIPSKGNHCAMATEGEIDPCYLVYGASSPNWQEPIRASSAEDDGSGPGWLPVEFYKPKI